MKAFIYELTIFLIFADVSTAFAETWMLESDVLTVTVDSQGGGFLAREKRSGRKWGTVAVIAVPLTRLLRKLRSEQSLPALLR